VAWLAPRLGLPAGPLEPLDPDLSTVQPAADKVFRLGPPAAGLLHLEAQSSWDGGLPDRLLTYNVLLHDRYGGPVHSVALLLRRDANSPHLTGTLTRADAAGREYLRFGYVVVRVWELPADPVLAGGLGVAPIGLLTDDAEPRLPELVKQFAERVIHDAPAEGTQNLLLSAAYILLGLRYDKEVVRPLFLGVQKMRESSTYQAILEEGRVEGLTRGRVEATLETRRQDLLDLLTDRFGPVPADLEARIKATTDPDRLRAALRQVLRINSPGELTL
jgi:hypothetical protein